jgi:class 3 adenylate cyclase
LAQNNLDAEKTQLEQAISHLEGQREALGDAVVDTALAPLREKLSQLDKQLLTGPSTSERRIVTILFCDVTGSTALAAELDPEEWTAIMQRIFPRLSEPVERYGGKVARLMGDGLLAFFGAPAAHEDDPERAVLAGLEILQGVAIFRRQLQEERDLTFNVRVGINTGLAVVGDVGSETAGEYTALGDAVNLAARMEQTAQPGTLQISQDTYKLIAPFFEVESLGAIPVKGLSEPVQTYRVQGRLLGAHQDHSRQAQGVAGIVPPITGREDELTTLRRLASQARQRRGQIVAIIGEAGLGKTRLIAELRNEWLAGPAVWQEMASTSYGGNRPYGTFQIQIQSLGTRNCCPSTNSCWGWRALGTINRKARSFAGSSLIRPWPAPRPKSVTIQPPSFTMTPNGPTPPLWLSKPIYYRWFEPCPS